MAFLNYLTNQIAIKIVYYGPGLSGKTTNLRYIYSHLDTGSRGELVCLETDTNRTFFFDLLPVKVGLIENYITHLHLFTIPGQIFYEVSRKYVLKGVDGIVFVADSQKSLFDANIESFDKLRKYLAEYNIDLLKIPLVFQYNKRDLKNTIPVETFNNTLNPYNYPYIEASAIKGNGVFDTLREITRLVIPLVREKILEEETIIEGKRFETTSKNIEISLDQKPIKKLKKEKIEKIIEEGELRKEVKIKKIKLRSYAEITRELDELSRIYTGKPIIVKKTKKKTITQRKRREIFEQLKKELARAKRNKEKLIISLLDIDNFKNLNEKWGIAGGNFILEEINELIQRNKRPYDLFYRYRNDEFLLVLVNVKKKQGIKVIQRIQEVVSKRKFRFNNYSEKYISLSAGFYYFDPKDDLKPEELIKLAGKALKEAKKKGVNQLASYS
jgi:hypothetical protein